MSFVPISTLTLIMTLVATSHSISVNCPDKLRPNISMVDCLRYTGCQSNGLNYICDVECGRDESRCSSGQCISRELVCDGKPDCSNGLDELKDICSARDGKTEANAPSRSKDAERVSVSPELGETLGSSGVSPKRGKLVESKSRRKRYVNMEGVKDKVGGAASGVGDFAGGVKDTVGDIVEGVGDLAGGVKDTVGDVAVGVKDKAGKLAGGVKDHFGRVAGRMRKAGDKIGLRSSGQTLQSIPWLVSMVLLVKYLS